MRENYKTLDQLRAEMLGSCGIKGSTAPVYFPPKEILTSFVTMKRMLELSNPDNKQAWMEFRITRCIPL